MKGGYTDNYYMQMAQNIRRYKGVRPVPVNRHIHKMAVDGSFADWDRSMSCTATPNATCSIVTRRVTAGFTTKILREGTTLWPQRWRSASRTYSFYTETADALTPYSDPDWMLLLIDSDGDSSTGWYGYDILINKDIASDGKGVSLGLLTGNGSRRGSTASLWKATNWNWPCRSHCLVFPENQLPLTSSGPTTPESWWILSPFVCMETPLRTAGSTIGLFGISKR